MRTKLDGSPFNPAIWSVCQFLARVGNDYADKTKPRFGKALEDGRTGPDGRILPIWSGMTDLTIPSLSGSLSDCING
jgi:hypothetical protein